MLCRPNGVDTVSPAGAGEFKTRKTGKFKTLRSGFELWIWGVLAHGHV